MCPAAPNSLHHGRESLDGQGVSSTAGTTTTTTTTLAACPCDGIATNIVITPCPAPQPPQPPQPQPQPRPRPQPQHQQQQQQLTPPPTYPFSRPPPHPSLLPSSLLHPPSTTTSRAEFKAGHNCSVWASLLVTPAVDAMAGVDVAGRRPRAHWRHEQQTVAMAVCAALHYSSGLCKGQQNNAPWHQQTAERPGFPLRT